LDRTPWAVEELRQNRPARDRKEKSLLKQGQVLSFAVKRWEEFLIG